MYRRIILLLIFLTTFAFSTVNIDDDMSSFNAVNQFDKECLVTNKTKQMIFAFKKSSGHAMKEFLSTKEVNYLDKKNILFVADVSGMPSFIKWFALPSLKNYPFSIVVLNDDKLSLKYKDEENIEKIMVVILKNKIVIDIKYFEDINALQLYLEK